ENEIVIVVADDRDQGAGRSRGDQFAIIRNGETFGAGALVVAEVNLSGALMIMRCPFWTRISVLVQSAAPATLTVFSAIAATAPALASFGEASGSGAVLCSSLGADASMGAGMLSRGVSAREGAVAAGAPTSARVPVPTSLESNSTLSISST